VESVVVRKSFEDSNSGHVAATTLKVALQLSLYNPPGLWRNSAARTHLRVADGPATTPRFSEPPKPAHLVSPESSPSTPQPWSTKSSGCAFCTAYAHPFYCSRNSKLIVWDGAQRMALLRNGLGAAVFPPEVKALRLAYAQKIDDGHMGPR
jgi:hypothetical protein